MYIQRIGILSQSSAVPSTVFFEDDFNRETLGADWDVTSLLSGVITDNKLVTEANANSWASPLPITGAKHTFASPLIGNFVAETNLTYVARTTDFAMIYMVLFMSDGTRLQAGINDSWGTELPRFAAYNPSNSYLGAGSSEPDSGSVTIKITRVGGIVKCYKNDTVVLTSSSAFNLNILSVTLTNTKLTTYNGKTAKWDYIRITQ